MLGLILITPKLAKYESYICDAGLGCNELNDLFDVKHISRYT